MVSYMADRLDTVGVQVKVGSRLAPYLIRELVQADRLHLLLGQLKELKEPVLRGVLHQVILLLFLHLQGRLSSEGKFECCESILCHYRRGSSDVGLVCCFQNQQC